jgi:hypothetical protein
MQVEPVPESKDTSTVVKRCTSIGWAIGSGVVRPPESGRVVVIAR